MPVAAALPVVPPDPPDKQADACDEEIGALLSQFTPRVDPAERPLPPDRKRNRAAKKRRKRTGNPDTTFDLRTEAYKLFGVDVTQIPGIETVALLLLSEVGRDLSKWPTSGYFVSWLALCPDNDISGGGEGVAEGMRNVHNRAGGLFRLAAY
jgi:transposase